MKLLKKCLYCQKEFNKPYFCSKKNWLKTKFCSQKCAGNAWKGHKPPKSAFKKGHLSWNKDKHFKLNDCLDKWRKNNNGGFGKSHPGWKGENAKNNAIHMWVKANKVKPNKCFNCGKIGNSRQLHWSNIDHQYKRNLDDYIARCPSCHKKYDLKNGLCKH